MSWGSDIDAVPEKIVILGDYIAKIDPDAENNPAITRHPVLPFSDLPLQDRRTRNLADDRPKLRDEAIAEQLHNATAVLV